MKNILLKIIAPILAIILFGFMVYYFLKIGAEKTVLRNNNELTQEPTPIDDFQNYTYQPTKVLPEMPLKNLFTSIVNDNEVDISISKSDYEWDIFVIEKNKNKSGGEKKMSLTFSGDLLLLSVMSKPRWDEVVENAKKDVEYFNVGNMELKQEVLNGVTWSYYDFFNAHYGGYSRTYFIEMEGYVLNFAIPDELIENNPNISLLPEIQFLKKLNFE